MSKKFLVPVVLPADPTAALEAATKQYVDSKGGLSQATADGLYVNVTGDTMTGGLTIGSAAGGLVAPAIQGNHSAGNNALLIGGKNWLPYADGANYLDAGFHVFRDLAGTSSFLSVANPSTFHVPVSINNPVTGTANLTLKRKAGQTADLLHILNESDVVMPLAITAESRLKLGLISLGEEGMNGMILRGLQDGGKADILFTDYRTNGGYHIGVDNAVGWLNVHSAGNLYLDGNAIYFRTAAFGALATWDTASARFSYPVVLPADPTAALQAAPKQYVDARSLPIGGTTGQMLVKTSATNYAVGWSGPAAQGPHGAVGYAQVTASQSGITSTVDVTGLSVTFTADSSRRYRTTVHLCPSSSVNNDDFNAFITDAANVQKQFYLNPYLDPATSSVIEFSVIETGLSGSVTRKVRAGRGAGTGTISLYAAATAPAFIVVEDITAELGVPGQAAAANYLLKAGDTATGDIRGTRFGLLDTNSSHHMMLKFNSDLTAERELIFVTGDAGRTITLGASVALNQDVQTVDAVTFARVRVTTNPGIVMNSKSIYLKTEADSVHQVYASDLSAAVPFADGPMLIGYSGWAHYNSFNGWAMGWRGQATYPYMWSSGSLIVGSQPNDSLINGSGKIYATGVVTGNAIVGRATGGDWYYNGAFQADTGSGVAQMSIIPGGYANQWREAYNDPNSYVRNTANTGYYPFYCDVIDTSARRYKQDIEIEPRLGILDRVRALRPVRYRGNREQQLMVNRVSGKPILEMHLCGRDCIDPESHSPENPCVTFRQWRQRRIGFIADEVYDVFPECAMESSINPGEIEGIKTLGLVAVLTLAVQELTDRIEDLEKKPKKEK